MARVRHHVVIVVMLAAMSLTASSCTHRQARTAIAVLQVATAVAELAAALDHHDDHNHGHSCGHRHRYYDGRHNYWYHGHWEYYDPSHRLVVPLLAS